MESICQRVFLLATSIVTSHESLSGAFCSVDLKMLFACSSFTSSVRGTSVPDFALPCFPALVEHSVSRRSFPCLSPLRRNKFPNALGGAFHLPWGPALLK